MTRRRRLTPGYDLPGAGGGPFGAVGGRQQPQGRYDSRRQDPEIVRGQVMDLGDLGGETVEPVLATFVWFGERFRVNPDMTETTLIDLFEVASKVDVDPESLDPKQMDFAKNYVREHIHPDDFDRLWKTAKANRQGIQPLMALCMRILGLVSERPTMPPSDSSGGRPVTNQNLPDGVSKPAAYVAPDGGADWWPEGVPFNPIAAKWVERFEEEGRPDKANIIMMAQEARARAEASAMATA